MMTFTDRLNDRLMAIWPDLTCRESGKEDAPILRGLIAADVGDGLEVAPPGVRALMTGLRLEEWRSGYQRRSPGSHILLLTEAGEMVGAVVLDPTLRGEIQLLDAIIHPARRNRGICSCLLAALTALSDVEGRTLSTVLMFDNPARRLLERHGFLSLNDGETVMEVCYRRRPAI